jgi:hypothetical protein
MSLSVIVADVAGVARAQKIDVATEFPLTDHHVTLIELSRGSRPGDRDELLEAIVIPVFREQDLPRPTVLSAPLLRQNHFVFTVRLPNRRTI